MKNRIRKVLRKLFTKDTDRQVAEIYKVAKKDFDSTARVAKSHRDLLRLNGVAMQIFIATGGENRHD